MTQNWHMQKYLYILLSASLLFSCTKENDVSMDFKITGANNKTVVRGEHIFMPLEIFYLGGEKEKVTVTAADIPAGISIEFDNATGEPDFALTATVTAAINLSPSVSTITFFITSESGKQISKSFELTVADPANKIPVLTLAGQANATW